MTTPSFILTLRRHIGHAPLWLSGVTAYVQNSQGEILLARRADTGEWALIYGINEPAEEPADTVIREVKEETGVECVPQFLASVKASPKMLTYDNGDQAQYLDHLFICSLAPNGNHTPGTGDGENTESGWFSPAALPSPLAATTVERMALARRFLAQGTADNARAALFSYTLLDTKTTTND
ncbi:MAG: NUDIX domain-containing protein [Bifidobacteriaceae bacterium]|jgi:8-oxo-dGTP pyrophosphatase MutT (NUDIX family)|nr:NUDIX domain-containing protein [Bifidobacteriaceae bacterium]MCI1978743.1 NUDIX domain-containing protein [Bifidobacteriaceae bacterium]